MIRHFIHSLLLTSFLTIGLRPALTLADEFADQSLSLFDGESLKGWEGNASWFHVDHGAIVAGRLDKTIPHNEFLCTTQNYDDFELRLEAKLIGNGNNAGVQFRSQRVRNTTEVSGYQADIGTIGERSIWGALYDESRRRKMLVETNQELAKQIVKPDQWNAIKVICKGHTFRSLSTANKRWTTPNKTKRFVTMV